MQNKIRKDKNDVETEKITSLWEGLKEIEHKLYDDKINTKRDIIINRAELKIMTVDCNKMTIIKEKIEERSKSQHGRMLMGEGFDAS